MSEISAAARVITTYGDDLRRLSAEKLEEVPEGVKVTFGDDVTESMVMSLIRDEVDGVKLLPTHSASARCTASVDADTAMRILGGGDISVPYRATFQGLEGVTDVGHMTSLKGISEMTVFAENDMRATTLRNLLRDNIELSDGDSYGMFASDSPGISTTVDVVAPQGGLL